MSSVDVSQAEELVFAPPQSRRDTAPVDAVRAFVFTSGGGWLRNHGYFERFVELVPKERRELLTTATANDWIALDDALLLYRACDGLNLSPAEAVEIGKSVAAVNNGTVMQTVLRLVGKVATPWTALGHLNRAWLRSNRGGAVAVYRASERQARMEFWACPLATSPFFRTSMRGAIAAALDMFCDRCLVQELPELATHDGFALRAMW